MYMKGRMRDPFTEQKLVQIGIDPMHIFIFYVSRLLQEVNWLVELRGLHLVVYYIVRTSFVDIVLV